MPALIILSYLSLASLGLIDNIRGPFYPEVLTELGLDGTSGSLFFAVTSLVAFFASFGSHWLLSRWSTLRVLLTGSFVFGAGFALMSRAPSFALLIAGCAIFGMGFGVLNVTQNVLVCEASDSRSRRRWLSGLHSMYGISALIAPMCATVFRSMGYSWRECFLVVALFPIAIAGVGIFYRAPARDRSADNRTPFGRTEKLQCAALALIMALYLWGELSASTRLVLWLRREREFSPESADSLLASFFVALLAGRMLFTFVHLPRLGNFLVLGLSAGLGSALYFAGLHGSPWLIVAAGLCMSPFYPVIMDQASRTFGNRAPQALSWIIGTGNLSLVIMHVVIGWVTDLAGVTWALHCGVACLALAALVLTRVGRLPIMNPS